LDKAFGDAVRREADRLVAVDAERGAQRATAYAEQL